MKPWEITNEILVAAHERHPLDLCARLDWLHEQAHKTTTSLDRERWDEAICLTRNGVVYTRKTLAEK